MDHDLADLRDTLRNSVRVLPPVRPPACVVDNGRVRIGAGLGQPAVWRG